MQFYNTLSALVFASYLSPGNTLSTPGCSPLTGSCQSGPLLDTQSAEDVGECGTLCSNFKGCNFYTYYIEEKNCLLYSDCSEFSPDNCETGCESASLDCICMSHGTCQGLQIGVYPLNDLDSCIQSCENEASCKWWSYDNADNFCLLFSECDEIHDSCLSCYSGEKLCKQQEMQRANILIVGSGYKDGSYTIEEVEVIPLDAPYTKCPDVPASPDASLNALGFVHDGMPVFCAVEFYDAKQCIILNKYTWEWEDLASTQEDKSYGGGAQNGPDYVMLGGESFPAANHTEVFHASSETFSMGPDMPYPAEDLCVVAINSSHVVMTGGVYSGTPYRSAALLDVEAGTWTMLPEMNSTRYRHGCGLVSPDNGEAPFIVSVLGWRPPESELYNCEMLRLDDINRGWEQCAEFPNFNLYFMPSVPYGNSFLLVGGDDGSYESDDIYEFNWSNMTSPWVLKPEHLKIPRGNNPVAVITTGADMNCVLDVPGLDK